MLVWALSNIRTRWKESVDWCGEEALIVPLLVPDTKSAFQAMIEYWVGTEELVYLLADRQETVEHTLAIMGQRNLEAVTISAASGAEVFTTWEDTSTTNISPGYYQRYIRPEIDRWCTVVHEAGCRYLQHACGTLRHLIDLMGESDIDGIESISPPPTGDIELAEARGRLKPRQALIGGIEPTVFLNASSGELEDYVRSLLDEMAETPFILANSDSCPPGVAAEKFYRIGELVRQHLPRDRT